MCVLQKGITENILFANCQTYTYYLLVDGETTGRGKILIMKRSEGGPAQTVTNYLCFIGLIF